MCNLCNRISFKQIWRQNKTTKLTGEMLDKHFPIKDKFCSNVRRHNDFVSVRPTSTAFINAINAFHSLPHSHVV